MKTKINEVGAAILNSDSIANLLDRLGVEDSADLAESILTRCSTGEFPQTSEGSIADKVVKISAINKYIDLIDSKVGYMLLESPDESIDMTIELRKISNFLKDDVEQLLTAVISEITEITDLGSLEDDGFDRT